MFVGGPYVALLLLLLCGDKAMIDAMKHAEDALTRFVKSSTRLARPAEVEKKRVDLMVRELLTVRPYSEPSQIKIRSAIQSFASTDGSEKEEEGRLGAVRTCNVEKHRSIGLRRALLLKYTRGYALDQNIPQPFETRTRPAACSSIQEGNTLTSIPATRPLPPPPFPQSTGRGDSTQR